MAKFSPFDGCRISTAPTRRDINAAKRGYGASAADLTRAEAVKFIAHVKRLKVACTCEHEHFECSSFAGGPCLDETLNTYPDLA